MINVHSPKPRDTNFPYNFAIYTCIIAKTTVFFMYMYESKPSYSPKSYIPHLKKQLQSPNTQSYDYTVTLNPHFFTLSSGNLKGVEIR